MQTTTVYRKRRKNQQEKWHYFTSAHFLNACLKKEREREIRILISSVFQLLQHVVIKAYKKKSTQA